MRFKKSLSLQRLAAGVRYSCEAAYLDHHEGSVSSATS